MIAYIYLFLLTVAFVGFAFYCGHKFAGMKQDRYLAQLTDFEKRFENILEDLSLLIEGNSDRVIQSQKQLTELLEIADKKILHLIDANAEVNSLRDRLIEDRRESELLALKIKSISGEVIKVEKQLKHVQAVAKESKNRGSQQIDTLTPGKSTDIKEIKAHKKNPELSKTGEQAVKEREKASENRNSAPVNSKMAEIVQTELSRKKILSVERASQKSRLERETKEHFFPEKIIGQPVNYSAVNTIIDPEMGNIIRNLHHSGCPLNTIARESQLDLEDVKSYIKNLDNQTRESQ